ncbi:MAG: putative methyltransferase [Gaiellaceae bacterium]|nr:putative methyltransferase [Gaiellaceae bacterium]
MQVNTAVDSSFYLPYSVGLLQAYLQAHAHRPDRYRFALPIIEPLAPSIAAEALAGSDIVGFSTYVWNANRSLAIARELKAAQPDTLIVFGGPHVPDDAEQFLRAYPCIDVACHGEGEQTFFEIAESYPDRDWEGVAGVSFTDGSGRFVTVPRRRRIADLTIVPSPFLAGVFSPLFESLPSTKWRTVWETNRGCPFKCTFCDWGSATAAKVNRFDLDRIRAEAEWIAANGIDYLFIGDANFGILPRDVEIAEMIAAAAKRHGHPKRVLVQQTKNATERAYETMKTIAEAGLAAEMNISIQTTTPAVLEAIKRKNISLETYGELQRRFVRDGIPTFVDMIVGLPGETPLSFKESVSRVVEGGQHHRVQFHNLTILPNAEMGEPGYRDQYGLKTVTCRIVNNHAPADAPADGIFETQELVIASSSCSEAGWRDMRSFAWLTLLYHMHRLLQMPILVTWKLSGQPLWRVIDSLVGADADRCPTLAGARAFCLDFAERMQRGGDEYVHSADWLDQFWTVDEFLLIRLCLEDRLSDLYAEAREALTALLPEATAYVDPRLALDDATRVNQARMRPPLADGRVLVDCDHDVHEFCEAVLHGEEAELHHRPISYEIGHRTTADLDAWLRYIVRDRAEDKLAKVVSSRRSPAHTAIV